jgi:hypothetical protein
MIVGLLPSLSWSLANIDQHPLIDRSLKELSSIVAFPVASRMANASVNGHKHALVAQRLRHLRATLAPHSCGGMWQECEYYSPNRFL